MLLPIIYFLRIVHSPRFDIFHQVYIVVILVLRDLCIATLVRNFLSVQHSCFQGKLWENNVRAAVSS